MKEELKQLIRTFHKKKLFFKKRDITIPFNTGKIISLIGSRRVGKTHIFYQLIEQLQHSGINIENILYINFEDERFDFKKENLKIIIEAYAELYPDNDFSKCYFFFDEVQNIDEWEKFVRRIYDNYTKNIFLTGSSAKLLSSEIATALRGRSISYEIYPLSFKEYLNFKEIKIDIYDEKTKFKIKHEYDNFILEGSYPEILDQEEQIQYKIYQEYLNVTILKDIIERYNLKNREILNLFIKKTLSNISVEFSINKFYNQLKSQGMNLSKNLIYELPGYLQDVFLIYFLEKFDKNSMRRGLGLKKIYSNDIGFVNLFKFSEDKGRILENVVFLELKRREKEIYYHKEKNECDFILKEKFQITNAIQVTQSLSDPETRKREIAGLLDACKSYNLSEGLILTQDEEDKFEQDGVKIKVLPVWKWLLSS